MQKTIYNTKYTHTHSPNVKMGSQPKKNRILFYSTRILPEDLKLTGKNTRKRNDKTEKYIEELRQKIIIKCKSREETHRS